MVYSTPLGVIMIVIVLIGDTIITGTPNICVCACVCGCSFRCACACVRACVVRVITCYEINFKQIMCS